MSVPTTRVLARDVPHLLAPPHDTTWAGCLASHTASRSAAQLLDELGVEYRRHGGFEKPVLWDVDHETGEALIMDGVHRVIVAASMNGWVELHRGWLPDEPGDEQFVRLTFDIDVPPHLSAGEGIEVVDVVLPLVSSFRLPSGRWVNCDSTCWEQEPTRLSGGWHCPHPHADEVAATVLRRLRAAGVEAVLVDVERYEIW